MITNRGATAVNNLITPANMTALPTYAYLPRTWHELAQPVREVCIWLVSETPPHELSWGNSMPPEWEG